MRLSPVHALLLLSLLVPGCGGSSHTAGHHPEPTGGARRPVAARPHGRDQLRSAPIRAAPSGHRRRHPRLGERVGGPPCWAAPRADYWLPSPSSGPPLLSASPSPPPPCGIPDPPPPLDGEGVGAGLGVDCGTGAGCVSVDGAACVVVVCVDVDTGAGGG